MSLPVYQQIQVKSASLEDLGHILNPEMNLKHPVVLNLKTLNLDQQREMIGLVENFFVSHSLSFKFPYSVYLLTDHETSIAKIPLVRKFEDLPKFFTQRDSKMNVKESHLANRNKLLQQEIRNSDARANEEQLSQYGEAHRMIYILEQERKFYRSILTKIVRGNKNG